MHAATHGPDRMSLETANSARAVLTTNQIFVALDTHSNVTQKEVLHWIRVAT